MTSLTEHTIELAGEPVHYLQASGQGRTAVVLHSLPTSSADWLPFLRHGPILAPDLPGFGRSSKGGHLGYALEDHVRFLATFLDAVLPDETVALGGHGWGAAVALTYAKRHADRVARLAIIDALPLVDGFAWPRVARYALRPGIGELVMGSVTRRRLARVLRAGAADPGSWPDETVDAVWKQFDQGTQRAVLRVARSIDPAQLAAAGAGLTALQIPVLIVWGEQDAWLPVRFGHAYAALLPDAELMLVARGGHWPWLQEATVIDRVTTFLATVP